MIVLDHNSSLTSARDMKNVVVKMNSGVDHRLYFSNITFDMFKDRACVYI